MFKEIFLGKEKIFTPYVILLHVVLFSISFAFVYIFSYSTSFRYDFFGGDSAVFQVVGKYWLEGFLPYRDLFDHKAPLVYVFNAFGYMIYPRSGIMVPQIICLYLSCVFLWRAMEFYSRRGRAFFLFLTLIYYAAHYQEGNHVEEYSVLFLSAAIYFFLRSLKENKFPPLYGFVYGFGFGACFLIRISDAAQICCQVLLVAIFLLQARDFKNLWQNFLSFCAGAVIIVLPFVIYFAAHGALYEMFYGTILFNLKYTALLIQQFSINTYVIYFSVHFMPLFILVAVSLYKILSDTKSRLAWSGLFIGAAMLFMMMNFRLFRHYCMTIFPVTPLLFALIVETYPAFKNLFLRKKFFVPRFIHLTIVLTAALFFAGYIFGCHKIYIDPFKLYIDARDVAEIQKQDLVGCLFLTPQKFKADYDFSDEKNFSSVEELTAMIPDAEKNSVVTWGHYCTTPHWVLEAGIKSRERLFFLNYTFGVIDPAFREEWFGNVRKNYPLWILYGVQFDKKGGNELKPSDSDAELEQLLAEKYSLKGETFIFPQVMKLYRLND